MDCPRCGGLKHCKDGMVHGRPRYQCKACRYRYTVAKKSYVKSEETRQQAHDMYLEGLGFRHSGVTPVIPACAGMTE